MIHFWQMKAIKVLKTLMATNENKKEKMYKTTKGKIPNYEKIYISD